MGKNQISFWQSLAVVELMSAVD